MSESSAPIKQQAASLEEALEASRALAANVGADEVALAAAAGRVLLADQLAPGDFPPFDSSAMDGWALRASDAGAAPRLVGESRAGIPYPGALAPGEAVKISTGAMIPRGADAVVPLETGSESGGRLVADGDVEAGRFIRPAGRYLRSGERLVAGGTRIGAGEIAALAAGGIGSVYVRKRLRATLICGGDELSTPGDPLAHGAVYDCNTPMLARLMTAGGCDLTCVTYASDHRAAVTGLLERAIAASDLVVTCGGISVGPHDHLPAALERAGARVLVNGTTARPGLRFRLSAVATRTGETPVFSLPGNPLSAWFGFQLYLRRYLSASFATSEPPRLAAATTAPIERQAGRTTLVPGRFGADGATRTFTPVRVASDAATAIAGCDAYAIVEPGEQAVASGAIVDCEAADG